MRRAIESLDGVQLLLMALRKHAARLIPWDFTWLLLQHIVHIRVVNELLNFSLSEMCIVVDLCIEVEIILLFPIFILVDKSELFWVKNIFVLIVSLECVRISIIHWLEVLNLVLLVEGR